MYNAIYIIESFDMTKDANIFLAYGNYLAKRLETYKKCYKTYNIYCHYLLLKNIKEWNDLWRDMANKCKNGEKPIIHFICHGVTEGLKIVQEVLPWNEVLEQFDVINEKTSNLYVTMNVCYSASISDILLPNEGINPFVGCICAKGPIRMADAPAEPRFLSFYEAIIAGQTIESAANAFREEIKDEKGNAKENQWVILSKNGGNEPYEIEYIDNR